MKGASKAERDDLWRRSQQGGQQTGIKQKILASRAQSSFFAQALGRSSRKYHFLGLFLVLSVLIAYYLRQNTTSTVEIGKAPSDDRHKKINYITAEERLKISAALKTTGGNYTDLVGLMHQFASKLVSTGEILFPVRAQGGLHFMPFPFCTFPDRRVRGSEDIQHYEQARRWLKDRRNIAEMTPKMFVSTLKVLNQKITGTPHQSHNFRTQIVWLRKSPTGLFDESEILKKALDPEELKTAEAIIAKVNYITENVAQYAENAEEYHHKESITIDLYRGEGNILEKMAEEAGEKMQLKRIQDRRLTPKEKRLVKKLYDIKEELSPAQHAALLEQDFQDFLNFEGDAIAKAGKLQFLILKRHSFSDGNGRDARAITDEFLHQNDLPPVFYPSREEYHHIASTSVLADDPQILIDYLRQHINGQKYLQSIELAGAIQDECIEVAGGTDQCDGILLNVMARSGRGFC